VTRAGQKEPPVLSSCTRPGVRTSQAPFRADRPALFINVVPTMLKTFSVLGLFTIAALALTGCKSKEQKEAETAAVKAEQDKLQGK
jgi:hypothetical protein